MGGGAFGSPASPFSLHALKASLATIVTTCAIALFANGCDDPCGNRWVDAMVSPSGEWSAVLFVRDCGATTGFSLQMSLIREGDGLPNRSGNVLVLGDGSGWSRSEAPLVKVVPRWLSETMLELLIADNEDVVFLAESVEGIVVIGGAMRQDR